MGEEPYFKPFLPQALQAQPFPAPRVPDKPQLPLLYFLKFPLENLHLTSNLSEKERELQNLPLLQVRLLLQTSCLLKLNYTSF